MSIKRMMAMMAASLTFASSPAFSDEFFTEQSYYLGAQYTKTTIELSSGSSSVDWEPSNAILIGGAILTKNISIEGRYGFKAGSASVNDVSLEVSNLTGIYAKFATNARVSVYGVVGFSNVAFESNVSATNTSESGFSYGAGLDLGLTDKASLNLEYMKYYNGEVAPGLDLDVTALALGASYKF